MDLVSTIILYVIGLVDGLEAVWFFYGEIMLYICVEGGIEIYGIIKEMKQMDNMTEDEMTQYMKDKIMLEEERLKKCSMEHKKEDE